MTTMKKHTKVTNETFNINSIAVYSFYTILSNLEKRLQRNRQREFSSKFRRKIFLLAWTLPNLGGGIFTITYGGGEQ